MIEYAQLHALKFVAVKNSEIEYCRGIQREWYSQVYQQSTTQFLPIFCAVFSMPFSAIRRKVSLLLLYLAAYSDNEINIFLTSLVLLKTLYTIPCIKLIPKLK